LRSALEATLAEDPDDRATLVAYADLLAEEDDPRGEFISAQLALEDPKLTAAQRKKWKAREVDLLHEHERAWLGELAGYLVDRDASDLVAEYFRDEQTIQHRWERGFLVAVEVQYLTRRLAQALAAEPAARFLRELRVFRDPGFGDYGEIDPPPRRVRLPRGVSEDESLNLFELLGSPCLANLRVFQMGNETGGETDWVDCHCYTSGLEHAIRQMPRIEELHLMAKHYSTRSLFSLTSLSRLRVLHVEHHSDYPIGALARNPAVTNLERLFLHPHFSDYEWFDRPGLGYLAYDKLRALVASPHLGKLTHLHFRVSSAGDRGIRLLVESGFLDRLKVLDLRHGRVTDEGAKLLCDCPAARRLERLDLSRNQLTDAGVAALRALGPHVRCDDQHEVGSTEYLHEGDFE
jgi:uncharacterized protein (TIGR02996 family)